MFHVCQMTERSMMGAGEGDISMEYIRFRGGVELMAPNVAFL